MSSSAMPPAKKAAWTLRDWILVVFTISLMLYILLGISPWLAACIELWFGVSQ